MTSFSPGRLRSARQAAGLTLVQLGAAIGRSGPAVWMYEQGTAMPPAGVVGALADALRVPVGALFAGEGGDGNVAA